MDIFRVLAAARWRKDHSGIWRTISNSKISVEVILLFKQIYWFPVTIYPIKSIKLATVAIWNCSKVLETADVRFPSSTEKKNLFLWEILQTSENPSLNHILIQETNYCVCYPKPFTVPAICQTLKTKKKMCGPSTYNWTENKSHSNSIGSPIQLSCLLRFMLNSYYLQWKLLPSMILAESKKYLKINNFHVWTCLVQNENAFSYLSSWNY